MLEMRIEENTFRLSDTERESLSSTKEDRQ